MRSKLPLKVGVALTVATAAVVSVLWADRASIKKKMLTEERIPLVLSSNRTEPEITETAKGSVLGEREKSTESDNVRKKKLSILASVVKHNVNVIIADEDGKAVSGEEFHIFIRNADDIVSEYADRDRDGIIHARDLPSGKYSISFASDDRYSVASSVDIKVREEVEYASIARIIRLIKSEADVDTEKEDTANMREEDDGSLLESGGIDLEGGSIGIDVSRYNNEIDWKTVKESGVEFAIIRLGYRGSASGVLVEDYLFKKNYEEARAAGLKVGVYFVTQALNETEAEEEAEMVAALTEPGELSTPVFLDVESSGGRGDHIDKETRTANINAFCRKAEELGFKAGVYANKKWFNKYIDADALGDYKIWLAQYKVRTPDYKGDYDIWQYSSKGHVDGIKGYVDLNLIIDK